MGFLSVPTANLNYLTQVPGIFLSFLKKNIESLLFSVSPSKEEAKEGRYAPGQQSLRDCGYLWASKEVLSAAL